MNRALALVLSAVVFALGACSSAGEDALPVGVPGAPNTIRPGDPASDGGAAASEAGRPGQGGGDAGGAVVEAGVKPPVGSGGGGGPGAGEHDMAIAGKQVALHVPSSIGAGAPVPVVILLHGQGDTGRNFLNVWLAKGLPSDVILASPDDNTDEFAVALESALRGLFNVDTKREYVLGFSQGGGYAAFLLFDAASANRFAAVALASSGLAQNPSAIPPASAASPAIAVIIDPADPNNTWNQGLHVMEDFVGLVQGKGYDAKLTLHAEGHKLAAAATQTTLSWMFSQTK